MRLATALQTYKEITFETPVSLDDAVPDINATASALRQLCELLSEDKLVADREGRPRIFNDAGLAEIHTVAQNCERIYKNIVIFIQRANRPEDEDEDENEAPEINADPSALTPLTILRHMRWKWLDPRIETCQEQIKWLKLSLLLYIQIAHVAKLHLSRSPRPAGTFDNELAFRAAAEELKNCRLNVAARMARGILKEQQKAAKSDQRSVTTCSTEEGDDADIVKPPLAANAVADDAASIAPTAVEDSEDKSISPTLEELSLKKLEIQQQSGDAGSDETPTPANTEAEKLIETAVSSTFSSRLSRFLPSWAQSIFGSSDGSLAGLGLEGKNLEAWVLDSTTEIGPVMIPFSQEQLILGLQRAMKTNRKSNWHKYSDMSAAQLRSVNLTIKQAKTQSAHTRTCIGVQEFKRTGRSPYALVFLSLSDPPAPVILTTPAGCEYQIPYEQCREWPDMKKLVQSIYSSSNYQYADIMSGKWEVSKEDNKVIINAIWKSTIQPGDRLTLRVGVNNYYPARPPMPRPPGAAFPGFPRPPPPCIIQVSTEKYPLSAEEEEELRVVDFVAESKLGDVGVAQLLGRLTYVEDVESVALNKFSFKRFEGDDDVTSSSDSDSDSDSSSDLC